MKTAQQKALEALETIKDSPEYKALSPIVNKDVMALGTGEAFALRDSNGEIKAFKQRCHLSAQNGGLVQPVYNGPWMISAQGYEKWAEDVGASVIFPKELIVGNKKELNPYTMRDPKNNRIQCVYARAIAFRYSPKGLPVVCDWTTIFDCPSYRLIDLLGKAKKYPQAFRLLPDGMKPEEDGTWASYPFDESTNLFVNTAHNEALSWYSQILNREKKAIDFAQTFARRNALKHLSGLQKSPDNKPVWDISVICWRPTEGSVIKWDATQYGELQDRVTGMIEGSEGFEEKPKIITGKEDVGDEAVDIDPEDEQPEHEQVADLPFEQDEKVLRQLEVASTSFPEEFEQACSELSFSPDTKKMNTDELKAVYSNMQLIISGG